METQYDSHNSTLNYSYFNEADLTQQFNGDFSRRVLPVTVIFSLMTVFGFMSNAMVVFVYAFKYKRCNFKYFLFVMGVIGLVQCSIMLPTQAAEMHYWFVFPESWLCRVSAYVFGYTIFVCYFVLLLISIDRFRKVCRPHDWQIQANTARNLCILISIASLVFALPPGFISGHHTFVTSFKGRNITVTVCATDDIYQNKDWAVYFLLLCSGLPMSIVILVTCVLYGLIFKQFYQGNSNRTASTQVRGGDSVMKNYPGPSAHERVPGNESIGSQHLKLKFTESVDMNEKNNAAKSGTKFTQLFLKNGISFKNTYTIQTECSLRMSRSVISRRSRVRNKIMRNTFKVLIITISCLVAIILTFCMHSIADDINRNALSISEVKLLAFVIFHRGSFSIVCAVFPILYGVRDPSFRRAILRMFSNRTQSRQTSTQTVSSTNEDSKW